MKRLRKFNRKDGVLKVHNADAHKWTNEKINEIIAYLNKK